jgi:hypothetical protein
MAVHKSYHRCSKVMLILEQKWAKRWIARRTGT